MVMSCFFFFFPETIHKRGYGWLGGQINASAVAVMTRVWQDAISAYEELQKSLV